MNVALVFGSATDAYRILKNLVAQRSREFGRIQLHQRPDNDATTVAVSSILGFGKTCSMILIATGTASGWPSGAEVRRTARPDTGQRLLGDASDLGFGFIAPATLGRNEQRMHRNPLARSAAAKWHSMPLKTGTGERWITGLCVDNVPSHPALLVPPMPVID